MMFRIRLLFVLAMVMSLALYACSSVKPGTTDAGDAKEPVQEAEEFINLNINETLYFQFNKQDSSWTGKFQAYRLNPDGEKEVQARYKSASDNSWDDFGLFVEALNIYSINPQYELEGWVPDSGNLPRQVITFEVFNGDTLRTFSYQDPELLLRNYWQAQSIVTFMTFVQNDLRWKPMEPENAPAQ